MLFYFHYMLSRNTKIPIDIISIEDDGRGFASSSSLGNGLKNMEARMKNVGGTFSLQSKPGKGTRIELQITVKPT